MVIRLENISIMTWMGTSKELGDNQDHMSLVWSGRKEPDWIQMINQ